MSHFDKHLNDPSLDSFLARLMRDPSQRKAYLASRAYYLLKQKVAVRSNGKCERCGIGKYQQLHHLTYERFGRERMADVQGLCRSCHAYMHGRTGRDPLSVDAVQLGLFDGGEK